MLTIDIVLPSWVQCEEAHKAERANALEEFIYEHEPAGAKNNEWRGMLIEMLVEAIEEDRRSRPTPV